MYIVLYTHAFVTARGLGNNSWYKTNIHLNIPKPPETAASTLGRITVDAGKHYRVDL
jgi:hypothetical protein